MSSFSTAYGQMARPPARCEAVFSRPLEHSSQSFQSSQTFNLSRAIETGLASDAFGTLLSEAEEPLYVHGTSVEALQAALQAGGLGYGTKVQNSPALLKWYPQDGKKTALYAWQMDQSTRQSAASNASLSAKDHQKLTAFGVGFRFREAIDILFRPLTQDITYEALELKLTNDLSRIEHLDDPMNFKNKLRHQIILLQLMRAKYSEHALTEKAAAIKSQLKLAPRSGILIVLKQTPNTKVVTDPELGPSSKAFALISENGLLDLNSIEAIIPLSSADRDAVRGL